jgi:phage-related protein
MGTLRVVFYQTAMGGQPVREWLRWLPKEQRTTIGEAIMEVQIGWPLGMPIVRKLQRSLQEIRASLPPSGIARVIFTMVGTPPAIILLHAFIRKSEKTPLHDLNTARDRLRSATP